VQHLLPKLSLAFLVAVLELSLVCLQGRMYNLCICNCHHMVVHMLNRLRYQGKDNWEVVGLVSIWSLQRRPAASNAASTCRMQDVVPVLRTCVHNRLLGSSHVLLTLAGVGY